MYSANRIHVSHCQCLTLEVKLSFRVTENKKMELLNHLRETGVVGYTQHEPDVMVFTFKDFPSFRHCRRYILKELRTFSDTEKKVYEKGLVMRLGWACLYDEEEVECPVKLTKEGMRRRYQSYRYRNLVVYASDDE